MNPLPITQLRELAGRASSGKWAAVEVGQGGTHDNPIPVCEVQSDGRLVVAEYLLTENAAFIAAANPSAVLAMVERIEALETVVRKFVHEFGDKSVNNANVRAARALLES
jgi:hypothetical protein